MQHQLTLVKVRPTKQGHAYIQRLLAGEIDVELEQKKNPWLLYWCQWYDPWSMSQVLVQNLPVKEMRAGVYEILDAKAAATYIRARLRRKYQWEEAAWLHRHLLEAIGAYEGLCPARIFLHDRCTGASLGDEELIR